MQCALIKVHEVDYGKHVLYYVTYSLIFTFTSQSAVYQYKVEEKLNICCRVFQFARAASKFNRASQNSHNKQSCFHWQSWEEMNAAQCVRVESLAEEAIRNRAQIVLILAALRILLLWRISFVLYLSLH